jgi:transcription antitermination protein NusB
MLNRRHLRIKVLQALYAYYQSNEDSYHKSEKDLLDAVEKIYDLYIYLLLSFGELKTIAERRIEDNKKKIRPSDEEMSPNLKFVNNQITQVLEESKELRVISEERKVNWVGDDHQEMFRKMLLHIRESETFFEFMNNEETGFEEDRQFVLSLFKTEIANYPLLHDFFEEKSIQWLDDIDLACSMVLKTIKNFSEEGENSILALYKDKDDELSFIKDLLRKTISMDKENEAIIDGLTENWEFDRIAKMDVILMKMAITEFQIFNNIPTKVTLNEYIEISKFYSTPKSNTFINGVLDKAIRKLTEENKIQKVGRGLVN